MRIYSIVFLFFLFGILPVAAQTDPLTAMNARALRLIDSTNARLNIRFGGFNEELGKINQLKPLDLDSNSKANIPATRQKIKDFLNYLDVFRTMSARLTEAISDSVQDMRSVMPSRIRESYLKVFLDAYNLDQAA